MRAAMFKGVGKPLEIETVDDLRPGENGVLLKVGRSGICTSDLHFTDGQSEKYAFSTGSVFGHEVSGEVVEIGKNVTSVKVGDRIAPMPIVGCDRCEFCMMGRPILCAAKYNNSGGYAEFVLASDRGMVKLPNTLTMSDGAMIEPLAVALHGVLQTPIKAGSRVLVLGAGPIGLSAVFWAKRMGATKVAVCELSRLREDIARTMGADEFIVGSEHDRPLSDVVAEKMGRLPDVVLECVGFPGMLGQAIECIHPVGTIGIVGFCVVKDGFVPADVIAKEARMIFSSLYNLQEYEHVARTLDAGAVEPRHMLSRTICLRDLPAAFETLRKTGPDVKVHVDPWL